MRRRSVKVLDLLEHAIDLGNLDALFVLGKVSLVRCFNEIFFMYV